MSQRFFYTYEKRHLCSKCGVLKKGKKTCTKCDGSNAKKTKIGKVRERKHLVLKHKPFQVFWDDYYIKKIKDYRMHLWKMIILGKKFVGDVRDKALRRGDSSLGHDFTEYLKVEHNEEIQSSHFGGGVNVSMEGYTVTYFQDGDDDLILDFHSYLSDDKTQNSATVCMHMDRLIQCLMKKGVLKAGGRLLCVTDGCSKQYRSATSLHFMSHLSIKYNIIVDWC